MQPIREKFQSPDGTTDGTLQSCVRTNDLELVGDGTHLSCFQMLGNFSFGGPDYERSVEMWHSILTDLHVPVDCVHVHPDGGHHRLWTSRGYTVVDDPECEWSDGRIGGRCCEIYSGGVEVGNLVNTLGHSTDVGFGWERLVMVLEGKTRVDETSLFDQSLPPVVRDHVRTLDIFWVNGVTPGNKGRNYVCRRLLRRVLEQVPSGRPWDEWVGSEKTLREKGLVRGRKLWRKHRDKPPQWWWETCGLTPDDLEKIF